MYAKNIFMGYFDYFMVGAFVIASLVLVSMRDVLNNIPKSDLMGAFNFFVIAIRDTSWIIQIFIAGFIVRIFVSSARFIYKNFDSNWFITKFGVRQ